jgi:4-amino-4-deoxy-L-arabinose transferase-like glycosyltransferase
MTLVLAAAGIASTPCRAGSFSLPAMKTAVSWLLVTAVAAIPRFALLDRFPSYIDGDEAAFIVRAVEFQEGRLPNPFGPGFFSNPQMYPVVQSLVADAVGDGAAAYRFLSASIGTIGVLATWRLGVHLLGPPVGMAAALLLAAWPLHVHMSRVALNNVTDPTFLVLAILFLVRASMIRRPLDAVLSGFALGCAFYGYYGGRAFAVVVLAMLPALAERDRAGFRAMIAIAGWMVTGFATLTMPLLVAFHRSPAEFSGHMAKVSPVSLTTFREDPGGVRQVFLGNLKDALLYPAAGNSIGYFRHQAPFIGWPLTILLVVGIVALVVLAVRTRDLRPVTVLFVPWLALVAGIALTVPIAGQRYLAITPLWAIVAAAGLATLVKAIPPLIPSSAAWITPVVLAIVVAGIGLTNLSWLASEDRQIAAHGDYRTLMAWDIGWRLSEAKADGGAPPDLLIAGPPFVFAKGFPNLTFLAPHVGQVNVEDRFGLAADVPALGAGMIVLLVPERLSERCAVVDTYPGATLAEGRARDGTLLYVVAYRQLPEGWNAGQSPAGTTFTPVEASSCGSIL